MKKILSLILACVFSAGTSALFGNDIGFGGSISYSTIVATHGMRSTLPTGPEAYARFGDLVEAAVFATYGSGEARRFESYWSVVTGAEVRLAPSAKSYMPYAGVGVAYGYHNYAAVLPNDHMVAGYVSIAPLRYDLKALFRYEADVHPIVSVLQIKYGPFYFDGGNPSWYDMGNFIAVIDLVRVGVYFGK